MSDKPTTEEKLQRAKDLLAARAATARDSEFVYTNSAGKRCPRPRWLRRRKAEPARPDNVQNMPARRAGSK